MDLRFHLSALQLPGLLKPELRQEKRRGATGGGGGGVYHRLEA